MQATSILTSDSDYLLFSIVYVTCELAGWSERELGEGGGRLAGTGRAGCSAVPLSLFPFLFVAHCYCPHSGNNGPNNPEPLCPRCIDDTPNRDDLLSCSKCHKGSKYTEKYCNAHWPVHKIFCGLHPAETPAGENSVQAFLLPQDSNVLVLVRVNVGNSGPDATEHIAGSLGVNVARYDSNQFPQLRWKECPQSWKDSGFYLYYSTKTTLSENECAKVISDKIMKSKEVAFAEIFAKLGMGDDNLGLRASGAERRKKWKGPLLVVKTHGGRGPIGSTTYKDFFMSDVKYFAMFLNLFNDGQY